MSFLEKCKERFDSINSILCIGFDPVIEKIPDANRENIKGSIERFLLQILDNFSQYALAIKPNIAFYEQYGIDGLLALKEVIKRAKELEVPVILDAKRGDIGNTSLAYAKSIFEEFGADAVTLAPYMGTDSLSPFFSYSDKGFFILARTSNPGSKDFQLLKLDDGNTLYEAVTDRIIRWNKEFSTGIGAVAGATHSEELDRIVKKFKENFAPPLLIPGVGKQGGSFSEVTEILKKHSYPLGRVFINSSSKILYAYNYHNTSWLEASEIEIKKMLLKNITE